MLRSFILIAAFVFGTGTLIAQPAKDKLLPKVDERMEILCIAYKLATNKPALDSANLLYNEAINRHFAPYKQHPFILYLANLSDSFSNKGIDISTWELPSLAMHIGPAPLFEPLVPFGDTTGIDGWDDRTLLLPEFISMFRSFYKETGAEHFFKEQESYYKAVESKFAGSPQPINRNWIDAFFNIEPSETYFPVLSLQGFGNGDYIRVNFNGNRRYTHTIFACSDFNQKGIPSDCNNNWLQRGNLHEYIHVYVNQLVEDNMEELNGSATKILADSLVWKKVSQSFYNNNRYYLYESLVRAVSIVYMIHNPGIKTTMDTEISSQEKAGFPWMRGLVLLLNGYYGRINNYKNFRYFMPQVVHYFDQYQQTTNTGK